MIVPVNIVAVQCNQNNSLFVTTGVDYDSDGAVVGSEITSQYTLVPGDDLTGQPVEVEYCQRAVDSGGCGGLQSGQSGG